VSKAAARPRLRVAVVGLGWVATHRHLPTLKRNPDVEIVGVVDRCAEKADAVRRRFAIKRCAATPESPDRVDWRDEVDAVTIAAQPAAHHPLARAWLDAGKHVLLEKPMAMNVMECRDLEACAAHSGRTLGVVHNFQFARSVLKARAALKEGRLGELEGLWGVQLSNPRRRLPAWYEELPLGLFYDESPHFLYLLRAVTGSEIRLIDARVSPSRTGRATPHRVTAWLEGAGVPIQVDMAFEAPVSEWQLALVGTEAIAVIDIFRDILIVLPNDHAHTARDILQTSRHAIYAHLAGTFTSGLRILLNRLDYGNAEVVRRFVRAVRQGAEADAISATDGSRVVTLQHEVLALA
jgi:predicted dehydrogenase